MDQETTFSLLKASLTSALVLGCFAACLPAQIYAGARGCAIGVVFVQKQDGVEHIASYVSRILTQQSATILPPNGKAWRLSGRSINFGYMFFADRFS